MAYNTFKSNPNKDYDETRQNNNEECPQLSGTLLRVYIPAGAVINILNLLEVTTPSGICLIIRVPLLGGDNGLSTIIDAIKQAGGNVEVVQE